MAATMNGPDSHRYYEFIDDSLNPKETRFPSRFFSSRRNIQLFPIFLPPLVPFLASSSRETDFGRAFTKKRSVTTFFAGRKLLPFE